jgi:hypothetical protein
MSTPSSRKRSGAPTRGLGRGGDKGSIHDFLYKLDANAADAVVSRELGIAVGVVRRLANALQDAFEDHATALTHLTAYVLNHGDEPGYAPFIEWVGRNKHRVKALRLPRYVAKGLEQLGNGGCSLLWNGTTTRLGTESCVEYLVLIATALYHIAHVYASHNAWLIIDEGVDAGDVYITFMGGGDG